MAAADKNFRLSDITLPDLNFLPDEKSWPQLINFLNVLKQALIDRDREIKSKVNQLHVDYVTTEPTDAPENDPEPVFKIYKDNGNYYLYVYINSAWKRVTLV